MATNQNLSLFWSFRTILLQQDKLKISEMAQNQQTQRPLESLVMFFYILNLLYIFENIIYSSKSSILNLRFLLLSRR